MQISIEAILTTVYIVLVTLLSIINFFTQKSKKKINNENEQLESKVNENEKVIEEKDNELVKANGLARIIQVDIPNLMKEAEKMSMTGIAKKAYVLSQIVLLCAEIGLSYTDYADNFKSAIESFIDFSKSVNAVKKDIEDDIEK